jgi:hypothetical protein
MDSSYSKSWVAVQPGDGAGSDLAAISVRIRSLWQKNQDAQAREEFSRFLPLIRYTLRASRERRLGRWRLLRFG